MNVMRFRPLIKIIAFWTILIWITLVTLLIVLLIWDVVNSAGVERIVWTATTLTGGILLACVTIMGFAAAEEDAERRRIADKSGNSDSHLREALTRAKEESHR
jgi:hypothetical protein